VKRIDAEHAPSGGGGLHGGRLLAGHAAGVAGCITANTLPELFVEVEFFKHFCLGVPKETPVSVEYVAVADQPEIAEELCAAYREFLAIPEDVRPKAIPGTMTTTAP
jgi:hypothetical protein